MLNFLTKILTFSELTDTDGFKSEYVEEGNVYACSPAQQLSPEEVQMYEGQIGQTQSRFVEITCPVEVSDKVFIDGITYKCSGVSSVESPFGTIKYKKLILASVDEHSDQNSES